MKADIYDEDDLGTNIGIRVDVPAEYLEEAKRIRVMNWSKLVAQNDEHLMEKYLEGEEITNDELKAAIRQVLQLTLNSSQFFVVQPSKTKVFN